LGKGVLVYLAHYTATASRRQVSIKRIKKGRGEGLSNKPMS